MFLAGTPVWVPDVSQAFIPSRVESQSDDSVKVITPNSEGRTEFPKSLVHKRSDSASGRPPVTNMDELVPLNIGEVLNCVCSLFLLPQCSGPGQGKCRLYSTVGPVLVAMNPFESLPIYTQAWVDAYHKCIDIDETQLKIGPHCLATAEATYRNLESQNKQAMIICGESGAGKTVTTRKIIEYLCTVAKGSRRVAAIDPSRVVKANELLEAFGNATTTKNDNSSRFGKFTRIHFKKNVGCSESVISGCGQTHYLLERSRITGAPAKERNYHVFYMLVRSGTGSAYNLKDDPTEYKYCRQGSELREPGIYEVDDKSDFEALVKRMESSGFDADACKRIFEGIAATLHLGNANIVGDSSTSFVDLSDLVVACDLLGIAAEQLQKVLTHKYVKVPGETQPIESPMEKVGAEGQRDTVAKMIYSRIFDDIVTALDKSLRGPEHHCSGSVGILDIFGFENMDVNGFEQMFINLTNERIQHMFNTIMFDREKSLYEHEGIDVSFLQGPRNIECVELFLGTRPAGIVALLGDSIKSGQPDDKIDGEQFVRVLNTNFETHRCFQIFDPKTLNTVLEAKGLRQKGATTIAMNYKENFGITHYAGNVMYTVQGFVAKSRDALKQELADVLKASTKAHIATLFADDIVVAKAGTATVGDKFRSQLASLVEDLEAGGVRFVRCIKSNPKKIPQFVDKATVCEQLIRGGVMAALEARAHGLPERLTYEEFSAEFSVLQRGTLLKCKREQTANILCSILDQEASSDYKLGKTRVFMKSSVFGFLRTVRRFKINVMAGKIQRKIWFTRVTRVDKAWRVLALAEETARNYGVEDLNVIKEAVVNCKADIAPMYSVYENLKNTYGEDYSKIFDALSDHVSDVKKMYSKTAAVTAIVERYGQRKQQVGTSWGLYLSNSIGRLEGLKARITEIENEAAISMQDSSLIVDKTDLRKFIIAVNNAKMFFPKLEKVTFPNLQSSWIAEADLELEPWVVPSPTSLFDQLLQEAETLVKGVEELAGSTLKSRFAFKAAVQELETTIDESFRMLDRLDCDARECLMEGRREVAIVMSKATKAGTVVEEEQLQGKDVDVLRDAVAKFVEAVSEAREVVGRCKADLDRIKAERTERKALLNKVEALKAQVSELQDQLGRKSSSSLVAEDGLHSDPAEVLLRIVMQLDSVTNYCQRDIDMFRSKVELLACRVVAGMETAKDLAKTAGESARQEFQRRKRLFEGKT